MAAYLALVVVPLVVLFLRAGRRETGGGRPSAPVGVVSSAGPTPPALDLPPFDAYGAAEAPAMPDLPLHPVPGGAPVALSALVSGPTILHLWSLACRSCAEEWDSFERFLGEGAGHGFPPVVSVLVVPGEEGDPSEAARRELAAVRREGWFGRRVPGIDAPWAVREDRVLAHGDRPTADRPITGYPETFLLDGRRRVRLRLAGPAPWDVDTWRRLLAAVPDLQ